MLPGCICCAIIRSLFVNHLFYSDNGGTSELNGISAGGKKGNKCRSGMTTDIYNARKNNYLRNERQLFLESTYLSDPVITRSGNSFQGKKSLTFNNDEI